MKIVLIGSGNVATHLAKAFFTAGHSIEQIYSRDMNNAQQLASIVNAVPIVDLQSVSAVVDLYVISVKDDAIEEVTKYLPNLDGLVVHTAGSVSMDVLSRFLNYGVFYPFQTFTRESDVDFSQIPLLVESNSEMSTGKLHQLGRELSKTVIKASSEQRGALHISAVFACNFVNHMYRLSEDVLKTSGLPFELLHPLIHETANKVLHLSPSLTQTGPASRNDQQIIKKHLTELEGQEELRQIYEMLTASIVKHQIN